VEAEKKKGALRFILQSLYNFSNTLFPRQALRPYQLPAAQAIIDAVIRCQRGRSADGPNQFAVVFSRQAGKDETTAQLLAYLLELFQVLGGKIVLAAPTDRQAAISKARLKERLENPLHPQKVQDRDGYILTVGKAEARFLSAAPTANVRGETASLLLIANEAQDIEPGRWDSVFDPMAASTNATTLFLGTVWTSNTLLARQMKHLRGLEAQDGYQRVFLVDWREVSKYVPAYGERVRARIEQFGENHPFIQTEYFLKELDGDGGLFGPDRRALMAGAHGRELAASPGKFYALLVDVAGENENDLEGEELRLAEPKKDSTVVTVVEVEIPQGQDLVTHPTYRVVQRYVWTGVKHTSVHGRLVGLARDTWRARWVVVDATGVGSAVSSFLDKALPNKVIPFVFTSKSKSDLGWGFAGVIDSGRFKDYVFDDAWDTKMFWKQLEAVEYEVRPGPGQLMKWGVKDPAVHDDLVMSAALVAVLDGQDWRPRKAVQVANRL
jgi:hypothetical protein